MSLNCPVEQSMVDLKIELFVAVPLIKIQPPVLGAALKFIICAQPVTAPVVGSTFAALSGADGNPLNGFDGSLNFIQPMFSLQA